MANHVFRKITALWLLMPLLACAESFSEGEHYRQLSTPQPVDENAIVVTEFFWYGCPHCYDFEPYLADWKADLPEGVKFNRVPAIFREDWMTHARAYYAAESLGVVDKIHMPIFKAMHEKRQTVNTPEQLADLAAENGVDRKAFLEAMQSFEVDTNVRKAQQAIRDYQIRGVPAVAVNGKYVTSGSMVGNYPDVMQVIEHLIEKEKAPEENASEE